MKKTLQKIDLVLSLIILTLSVLVSVFSPKILIRVWQSVQDVGSSCKSYASAFYADEIHKSSVMKIPENFTSILPFEWDEFVILWKVYWAEIFTKDSFMLFIQHVGRVMEKFSKFFMPSIIIVSALGYALYLTTHAPLVDGYKKDIKKLEEKKSTAKSERKKNKIQKKIEKKRKKQSKLVYSCGVIRTKPFRLWEKFKNKIGKKVCFHIKHFFKYFSKEYTFGKIKIGLFLKLFILIWSYKLNVLTIVIEAVAYVLYFCSSDFGAWKIYTVLVKLAGDATVLIAFFNFIEWTVIVWILIEVLRRRAGKKAIEKRHDKDKQILIEYDGEILITGRQGKGKSTTGGHMVRLLSEMFRNDFAKPDLLSLSAQFPFFPWHNVEDYFVKNDFIFNRKEVISDFIEKLKTTFNGGKYDERSSKVRLFRRNYHYKFKNLLFGYDYDKYPTTYSNGIREIDIFETIEYYAELYFLYTVKTSLIFGIVPIREDYYKESEGFFPKYNFDAFQNPKDSKNHTRYCHIANQNSFRLGKTMQPNDPVEDGFEFGIEYTPEKGKERGNQLTNRASKADADECNPNNDGYEDEAKMMRHVGNIYFKNYRRRISDEQRAGSLQANDTQLCTIFEIMDTKDKIAMPFFWIGKDLMKWWRAFSVKKIETIRYYGREFSFIGHLWLSLIHKINRYFDVIENRYGVTETICNVFHGMDGTLLEEKLVYYKTNVIARNDMTRTDSIRMFYREKVLSATGGINEFPTFNSLDMTVDEMHECRSHFYEKLRSRIQSRLKKQ